MPIQYAPGIAHLVDQCAVEEAIELAEWLQATPDATLDLSECVHMHAAVLQTILALKPQIGTGFGNEQLTRWLGQYVVSPPRQTPTDREPPVSQWQ